MGPPGGAAVGAEQRALAAASLSDRLPLAPRCPSPRCRPSSRSTRGIAFSFNGGKDSTVGRRVRGGR